MKSLGLRPTRSFRFALLAFGVVAGSLLATPHLSAQAERPEDISVPPMPAFEIPQPERHVLDNGMVVMLLPNDELPLVHATALVRTGSRLEPSDHVGLASLTGSVIRSGGTESMSSDELNEYLEGKAATIESSIGTTSGSITMSSLTQDFEDVFAVFADVIRHPAFEEDKLEVARTAAAANIARQNDNAQQILFREAGEATYGADSPYAANITYETLGNIDRDDLVAWHARDFHPDRIILGLTGDFEPKSALALVEKTFGGWTAGGGEDAEASYRTEPMPGVFYAEKNDLNQSNIALTHLGIQKDHKDFFAVEVMNQVLSGSQSARLFTKVRTEKGLAYAVFGQVGSDWDYPGTTVLFTTTKVETTGAAIEALLDEAERMKTEPPTEEEVAKAKTAIVNSFVFNSDSAGKILSQQLTFEYFGYPLDWLSRYQAGIENVTTAQVRAAAVEHLRPEDFSILVVGPSEGRDRPLSDFGTVNTLDISIPEPAVERAEVTAEGAARGAELVAKAAANMGPVDTISRLRIAGKGVRDTPQGEMEITTDVRLEIPSRIRQDLTLPFGQISLVVSPDDAFMIMPQGIQDFPPSQAADVMKEIQRMPVMLLRARNETGFTAVATGSTEIDGTVAETVEIAYRDNVTEVAIDPDSGAILRLAYQGEGPQGGIGRVERRFSDYRETDGFKYPFRTVATFEGEQNSESTVEIVEVDPEIAADAFVRPES